jgi:hypothetical protein
LAFIRQWGGLPADTVVIEVEPDDIQFGIVFSDVLAGSFDPILDIVGEVVADLPETTTTRVGERDRLADLPEATTAQVGERDRWADLLTYAKGHERARHARSMPALVEGVDLAGRVRPWGVFTESGGDWFDAIPLAGDTVGIVMGDVPGRGIAMAVAMSELRAAVRAYVVMAGESPASVVGHLDRLAQATGIGQGARLIYAVLSRGGVVRFVNAGGCAPLLLALDGARFVDEAMSVPLGEAAGERPEAALDLGLRSALLLYTGGLVESRRVPRAIGMERLRQVAGEAPFALDALCDRVLSACTDGVRRDDDICLLALRA